LLGAITGDVTIGTIVGGTEGEGDVIARVSFEEVREKENKIECISPFLDPM
jgi:hypothetical protein